MEGRLFQTEVAVVPCEVPLLFSRPALSSLGLIYDVGGQKVSFTKLSLKDLPLEYSASGHPAVSVDQFLGKAPPAGKGRGNFLAWVPDAEAYMTQGDSAGSDLSRGHGAETVFFPKKVALKCTTCLRNLGAWVARVFLHGGVGLINRETVGWRPQ